MIDTVTELMELAAPTGREELVLTWCRQRWAELGGDGTTSPVELLAGPQ